MLWYASFLLPISSAVLSNVLYTFKLIFFFLSFRTRRWFQERDRGNPVRLYFTSRLLQLIAIVVDNLEKTKTGKQQNVYWIFPIDTGWQLRAIFFLYFIITIIFYFIIIIIIFSPNVSKFLRNIYYAYQWHDHEAIQNMNWNKNKKYCTQYSTIFKILIYRNKWFNIVSPLYLIMAIHLLKTVKTLHLTNHTIAFQQIWPNLLLNPLKKIIRVTTDHIICVTFFSLTLFYSWACM